MLREILWHLLKALLSTPVIIITVIAFITCLPRRYSIFSTVISFAALAAALTIINGFTDYLEKLPLPFGWQYIPLALLLFNGHVFQKLFLLISQLFISAAINFSTLIILNLFLPHTTAQISFLTAIASLPCYALYAVFLLKSEKYSLKGFFDGGSRNEWAFYMISVLAAYIFLFLLANAYFLNRRPVMHPAALFFLVWSFYLLCYAIINTHEKSKKKYEAGLAKEIIISRQGYYEKMNGLFEALRIMRNDSRHHQNVLLDFIRRGETIKAIEYLSGQQAQFQQYDITSFCDNQVINALLIWYAGRCKKAYIQYSFKTAMPEKLNISDYDLCIILGNLLENAFEANIRLNKDRMINLEMIFHNDQVFLKLENNCQAIQQNDDFFKNDINFRGLGIRSVRLIAERYNGQLFIKQQDNIFTATVFLSAN